MVRSADICEFVTFFADDFLLNCERSDRYKEVTSQVSSSSDFRLRILVNYDGLTRGKEGAGGEGSVNKTKCLKRKFCCLTDD